MKETIILDSHVNYLIDRLQFSDRTSVLRKRHAYALGAIRALFHSGVIDRQDYLSCMRSLRRSFDCKHSELMKPFWESLERG